MKGGRDEDHELSSNWLVIEAVSVTKLPQCFEVMMMG